MASRRILNITRGFRLKIGQVERGLANFAFAWVEIGVSVRDVQVDEARKMRMEQDRTCEPLSAAEIPGLSFEPPATGLTASRNGYALVRAAHEFCWKHQVSA